MTRVPVLMLCASIFCTTVAYGGEKESAAEGLPKECDDALAMLRVCLGNRAKWQEFYKNPRRAAEILSHVDSEIKNTAKGYKVYSLSGQVWACHRTAQALRGQDQCYPPPAK